MKRRTFQEYLKTRLNKDEIAEIKKQALREKNALQALREKVAFCRSKIIEKKRHND